MLTLVEHRAYRQMLLLSNPRRAARIRTRYQKWELAHPRARDYDQRKNWEIIRRYGITLEEYHQMFERQGGVCFICGKPPKSRSLYIDHEHVKGYVKMSPEEKKRHIRGLLCFGCNRYRMAGKMTTKEAKRILEYLENYERRRMA